MPNTPQQTPLPTGLLLDPTYLNHLTGEGHPETPGRYRALLDAFSTTGLADSCLKINPFPAEEKTILLCHDQPYLDIVKQDAALGRLQLSTGDTPLSPKTLDTALLAVGGVQAAVDSVMQQKTKNAFCAVRPPGHHASQDRGMGFCLFNNIAIAARYAQQTYGIQKVLIVDWDVHHGNGTQDIFYQDPSVFFFSTHQSPLYPGTGHPNETGAGEGINTTLNCPFPAFSGRNQILPAFTDKLLPAMQQFKPELVLISAGFDSRIDDPLGRFLLTDDDFAELTKVVMAIASASAQGRVVSVLEGGYNPEGLASAALAHVRTLMGTAA